MALPRKVLFDGAGQAATDVGLNDSERDCVMAKVFGGLTNADILLYFSAGASNTSTNSKNAVKECVTGDRVLPVATKAKQQAQADEVNRERFRQLSQAAIDRALADPAPTAPAPVTSTGP